MEIERSGRKRVCGGMVLSSSAGRRQSSPALFELRKENAGGFDRSYIFGFKERRKKKFYYPRIHSGADTNKTEDIKKHLMTYQTLFCNDGGGGGGGARALAQLDRVVSRCRQRDRGRKDVGYLVDAHSTRQRHFTAFVYIVYSGRHTLRCLKCRGNRGNSVRYLIFISSNGRRQLMDIDLHDQTILIFPFL